jgi:hypothetical protein
MRETPLNSFSGRVRIEILEEERMQKIGFLSLLIVATLLLTLTFPVAAAAPKTAVGPTASVAAAAPVGAIAAAMPERHPHIEEALEAMRSAKHHLESAEHDFRGHRAKSLQHLQMAIREAEICMSMP